MAKFCNKMKEKSLYLKYPELVKCVCHLLHDTRHELLLYMNPAFLIVLSLFAVVKTAVLNDSLGIGQNIASIRSSCVQNDHRLNYMCQDLLHIVINLGTRQR